MTTPRTAESAVDPTNDSLTTGQHMSDVLLAGLNGLHHADHIGIGEFVIFCNGAGGSWSRQWTDGERMSRSRSLCWIRVLPSSLPSIVVCFRNGPRDIRIEYTASLSFINTDDEILECLLTFKSHVTVTQFCVVTTDLLCENGIMCQFYKEFWR